MLFIDVHAHRLGRGDAMQVEILIDEGGHRAEEGRERVRVKVVALNDKIEVTERATMHGRGKRIHTGVGRKMRIVRMHRVNRAALVDSSSTTTVLLVYAPPCMHVSIMPTDLLSVHAHLLVVSSLSSCPNITPK
jgi:hypothetical protein